MIVKNVEKNSVAEKIGLHIGDNLLSINEHEIRDIIDYRFYVSDDFIELKISRDEQELIFEVEKNIDEELGLSFESIKFRCCGNILRGSRCSS